MSEEKEENQITEPLSPGADVIPKTEFPGVDERAPVFLEGEGKTQVVAKLEISLFLTPEEIAFCGTNPSLINEIGEDAIVDYKRRLWARLSANMETAKEATFDGY